MEAQEIGEHVKRVRYIARVHFPTGYCHGPMMPQEIRIANLELRILALVGLKFGIRNSKFEISVL